MVNRKPFTLESVGQLLVGYGVLDPARLNDLRRQEMQLRRKLILEREANPASGGRSADDILPPELIAGAKIKAAHDPAVTLGEDLIYELIARAEGLRYLKIDPLKLDAKVVTGFFSRPFARRYVAVPVEQNGTDLYVAVANPYDVELFEHLARLTGQRIVPLLAAKADILKVITEVYGFRKSVTAAEASIEAGVDIANLEQFFKLQAADQIEENDQHIVNAVDYLLNYAITERASDIHIEPKRDHSQIRLRIDGVLHDIYRLPKKVHPPVVSRLKAMSRLDIAERRRPQDGRMKMGTAEREIELRVSTIPTAFGEKAVLRIFDGGALVQDLDELGFDADQLTLFRRLIQQPHGLVLVTGPTGSGKTTTLYSALRSLASPMVNIVTIEDPIEMVMEPFNQIAVQRRIDLTFATALRSILRQDPDIIMVGEIRDQETAEHAIQAAMTGHLVLSTVHTNDAVTAVARLSELGVKPYLIASTLTMVVAQRLLRRLCPVCRQEATLGPDEVAALGLQVPEGQKLRAWVGEGCVKCRQTGLYGRTGIFEVLEVTDKLKRLIKEGVDTPELYRTARQDGMTTLHESAIRKLGAGQTSFDEVRRVLSV